MELIGILGMFTLSVGLSLVGARAMLATGLFLMTRAATATRERRAGGAF